MERKFPALFSPLRVGDVTLRNRIISAPMTYPVLTVDGCLTPEAIAFYEQRAKGGAAAVTVSELIVDSSTGKYYPIQVVTDAANAKDSLAAAARAVKRHGAVASMELSHGGMYALADKSKYSLPFGPCNEFKDGVQLAQAMDEAMMEHIKGCYYRAAALCKEAGFEMLLVHAGHGWLLHQFLSPLTNRRTDGYGGSAEARAKFPLEILDTVRAAVGPGFPIDLRISADEYEEGGFTLDDIIAFAKLAQEKVNLLQVSTGSHHDSFDKTHPSMFMPRGANAHFAAEIKKHVHIPVATIGGINEPAMMEELLSSGSADVIVMGRALLADPFLPRKALEGRDGEIVRCCRCFTCMAERLTTGLRICALNPVIGSEYELSFAYSPTSPKNVLIAGGGPGGMQCAITAAARGHKVTLCEKSGRLGGALNAERGISFKADLYMFIEVKAQELKKAGVDICLNTEVTPELIKTLEPEALVIAIGAQPVKPPIQGIDGKNVIMAHELPDRPESIGHRIAILGGGLVGCETAVHLTREGHEVTVIEMLPEICPDANGRHRPLLLAEMDRLGIKRRTGTRGVSVTETGLVCEAGGDTFELAADTVIIAAGQRSKRDEAEALCDCAAYVTELGDCVNPGQVTQAVFRGFWAAMDI